MKASFSGSYDVNNSDGTGSIVVNAGGVNLQASVTGGTFCNGPLLNDLTLSVESPGSFVVDYIVPKKDVRFQFMNTFKINEKPLNLTYTHSVVENTTSLDGTLALNSNHKVSANYGFKSGSCKVKYNYMHGGVTTIEPCYDFAENSWDVAVSRRVDDDSVVRASYQSSTRVLGLDLTRNSSNNRSIKVSASVNLADKKKKPTIKAESIWDVEI
ncbi:unnamed protein product [Lactuca saligna]|uniref:Uncharacterized protein n=1 Tax=Lactuca saligna TaxID=75948 RepID=A0AA35UNR1_LACSI|nr:unnamed protein product [Lactuca saligna]